MISSIKAVSKNVTFKKKIYAILRKFHSKILFHFTHTQFLISCSPVACHATQLKIIKLPITIINLYCYVVQPIAYFYCCYFVDICDNIKKNIVASCVWYHFGKVIYHQVILQRTSINLRKHLILKQRNFCSNYHNRHVF